MSVDCWGLRYTMLLQVTLRRIEGDRRNLLLSAELQKCAANFWPTFIGLIEFAEPLIFFARS